VAAQHSSQSLDLSQEASHSGARQTCEKEE